MKFHELANYFQKLESTSSRNQMIEILAELFAEADKSEVDKIAYLSQGRVAPLFEPLEFGMADRMIIRAIAQAHDVSATEVSQRFGQRGDLGVVAEALKKEKHGSVKTLSVNEVYEQLCRIVNNSGAGSVELKIGVLAHLLKDLDALSARYIVRIPIGKLRLGFSDMTVLDALSWMLDKTKSARPSIEKAYNVRPDLGFIVKTVKEKGIAGFDSVVPSVGTPILMARSERLSSAKEIIDKIGRCAIEPKIDGFRLAVHKNKEVQMFTRNMENVTFMYPDLVAGVLKQIKAKEVIFEGEAIAYNPQTGEYLPFQETVQRKRKYDIEKKAAEIPLKLICFDLLYLEGKNLIHQPYEVRRKNLEKLIGKGETLLLSEETIVEKADDLEKIFQDAISRGLEGVMAKRLDGSYQAGARGWNWIKYKRSYSGKLEDTIDAVVMGYDFGQGKRNSFGIGDFLIGIYDQSQDLFKTIAKIGTGLTDEEWRRMKKECDEVKANHKPARYDIDKLMNCDVWVEPQKVVVIRADEITRSPVHTAGRILRKSKSGEAWEVETPGFALRFPRLVEFRSDKLPEDATTLKEIEGMFKAQGAHRTRSAQ
ncbi:ATP-dependent DNA ligase [Candidatus Microgenomates bacterium]|nr:ATP-dependent DNA ligase [Candidatus Microgenomates bacterium]